ncbi:rod shape-determining protein MreD [Synechococcus sp. M16CYN]|uniref:rod shape-determining protein MreD n=1 Tax=Synechococcus sp. M16CYN TaxID=3103139 RepID=UPI0032566E38
MARLHRQPICVASALLVPLLVLGSPRWLSIDGVGPAWVLLWLLPWALVDGPVSGGLAGVALGLILDGLNLGELSQIPALLVLGWWWGQLGRQGRTIQRSLNLGLLAWIGSVGLGLSLLLQLLICQGGSLHPLMQSWGWQTLWSQALITGLLAPMMVSLQLLLWRTKALS